MKKVFMALALLVTIAYTASSQAFFGFGGCGTCVEQVYAAPVCDTCYAAPQVVYEAPACDTCYVNPCPSC